MKAILGTTIAGLALAFALNPIPADTTPPTLRGVYEPTGAGTGRCSLAPGPGGSADELYYAVEVWGPTQAPQGCVIVLSPGRYVINRPLRLGSFMTVQGADDRPRTRALTVLERASAPPYTGPLVEIGAQARITASDPSPSQPPLTRNVRLQWLTLDGRADVVQGKEAVNIFIARCIGCNIVGNISRNSPGLTSIAVYSARDLVVADNTILNNERDGLSVCAVEGETSLSRNVFADNGDMHLILGGGSLGHEVVRGNVVLRSTRKAGGAFTFDSEPRWSHGFGGVLGGVKRDSLGRPIDYGDFSAVTFEGNIDRCGPACQYGTIIGTHLNANWGRGVDYPPPRLPSGGAKKIAPLEMRSWAVRNLRIPNTAGNDLDRVTIDYLGAGSLVDLSSGPRRQFRTSCTYNASPLIARNIDPNSSGRPYWTPGTLNTDGCIPCGSRGSGYGYPPPAPMCDWGHDR